MKFKMLLAKPSKFKNRPTVDLRSVQLVNKIKDDDSITYSFYVRSQSKPDYYTCIIQLFYLHGGDSNRVGLESKVRVYCSCMSFRYQFAYLLSKQDALYGGSFKDFLSGQLENEISRNRIASFFSRMIRAYKYNHPPKKNTVTYICKHLEACCKKLTRVM